MSLSDLHAAFMTPDRRHAPMMRWWWFGPAVDRAELDRQLTAMADAGLGGVEVAYVYPFVEASDTFLSPDFLSQLRFAADRAAELGLRFDLTLGSGWSFGGPHIGTGHAARRLHWDFREIGPGQLLVPVAGSWPGDECVAAFLGPGSLQDRPEEFTPLAVAGGTIAIPAGAGVRRVLIAWSRLTGQNVKRAAVGAEGPVLDHYSAAATRRHLREVGDRLLDAVPERLVGSVFCDSLEVYGGDWTPSLVQEFRARRGYDLLPQLYRLVTDAADIEAALRLRADVGRTLAELYEENFVQVVREWANRREVKFRIQSYGTPPALISSARHADLIEGEGWGWTELTQTRWASSAAHLYHRPVVSSEVWTWVHSPSFRASPLDLKGEAHQHLLAGINAFVGHGWPYSPSDAPGIGWIFYAAGALDDRNPWWPAMPVLTCYLARLCGLLQQGEPVTDVLVYVSDQDVLSRLNAATGGTLDPWREARAMTDPSVLGRLRRGGWDYDLVDDTGLSALAPDDVRPILLLGTRRLSDTVRPWFERRIAEGKPVIGLNHSVSLDGVRSVGHDELGDTLLRLGVSPVRLDPSPPDVGVVRRRLGDHEGCLVVNTGPIPRRFRLRAPSNRTGYEQWDPDSGAVLRSDRIGEGIVLHLQPYQASILVLTDELRSDPQPSARAESRRVPLDRGWTVQTGSGTAEVDLPHCWEDVPGWEVEDTSARYRTTVELSDEQIRAALWLDFGPGRPTSRSNPSDPTGAHSFRAELESPVGTAAEVIVNGTSCGIVWAPPFRVGLGEAVRPGSNLLEIVVHGSAAQRLAADPHLAQFAATAERRHGRRATLQDIDRATVGLRSGLLTVPVLVVG